MKQPSAQFQTVASEINPRGSPSSEGRFIWVSTLIAERIVNELGATDGAFGMAVYMALAKLSWHEGKTIQHIETTVQKIAGLARLSYPKTLSILDALERAKAIAIERRERLPGQKTQLPHIYTLLSCRLNAVKSGRRNNGESGRLNGGGLTEVASCSSEIPKEPSTEGKKEKENNNTAPLDGNALEAQPSAGGKPKGAGCVGRF